MSAILLFQEERCKGCLLCVTVCPKKIITISPDINDMGYHPVKVQDQDKCTGCSMCALVCPDLVIEVLREESTA